MTEKKETTTELWDYVSELAQEFEIKISKETKLSFIQRHLISKYGIFWVPFLNKINNDQSK